MNINDIRPEFAIRANDSILGAVVKGLDLSQALNESEILCLLVALGRYGVLRFPAQTLTAAQLKTVAEEFGTVQTPDEETMHRVENVPEVAILSNDGQSGVDLGPANEVEAWHTNMSYYEVRGFATLLYARTLPQRVGRALGMTSFANMYKAYKDLPEEVKSRLEGATALHSPEQYYMRLQAAGNQHLLRSEEHRKKEASVAQPLVLIHPVSRKKLLYANPEFTVRIDGWSEEESAAMLAFLFQHQIRHEYQYTHYWEENDLLIWDNLSTIHRANTDYEPHEQRLAYRCQVLADRYYSERLLSSFSEWIEENGRHAASRTLKQV